ncbi:MAG: hypothetical protein K5643_09605 [Saccharofermentans sp.]|nr:hypothetical protein [Saccharofermentans sp.]
MQNAIPESDFNRKEYEDSGDAAGAGTKDIAGEMEKYFTDKTVKMLTACGGHELANPRDYPDWEMDYVFNMRIKITDLITDDLMNREKYPLDNRYICIHYLEEETDRIIYTTDLNAVRSIMDYLSNLYCHEENEWERTPYENGSEESFYYRNYNRSMSYLIDPLSDSEDHFLTMKFYSC